ncbi:AMP-binding protein [Oceanicoccus sp. KOV_DT_Chl]|uniref:AMP-binding protein n=1 Tax=Oceanicoccus sp. KOV_DT_Chl TaxID=1904639 RepID=UPI000C7C4A0B|nr:AMP-binding protein [Oceanicoccus sp. KOV_DT_Chl]
MSWNYSEAVDRIGQGPMANRTALIHEHERITFAELRSRARGIGAWLQAQGLKKHSHVGHYLRNSNAYLEAFLGSSLIGCAHVNINYRYQNQELEDLCNSQDVEVLVYAAEFAQRVAEIKPQLKKTVAFVEVPDSQLTASITTPINDFAELLSTLYTHPTDTLITDTDSNNHIIIATGGTTGMPKGTQWEHTGLWHKMKVWSMGVMAAAGLAEAPASLDHYLDILQTLPAAKPLLPLCPLMHGTGLMMAITALAQASPVATTDNQKFDADHCLNLIADHQVGSLVIVGDAFALPLLDAIEARNDGCFQSVKAIVSSGAILSDRSRARFIEQNNDLILLDTLGSSETSGFALTTEQAGVFLPMPTTKIFDDDLNEVIPGSDTIGIAYAGGFIPIGYYNEPEKTADTFVIINGERFVKTGDRCKVRADGLLELLGRDNSVINTGGEKVYTIEVEQLLIRHNTITDALLVGLPHPRFGKMVVAVVEGQNLTAETIDVPALQAYLKQHLADYKVPKKIYPINSMQRFANGKVDYAMITEFAADCLAKSK